MTGDNDSENAENCAIDKVERFLIVASQTIIIENDV